MSLYDMVSFVWRTVLITRSEFDTVSEETDATNPMAAFRHKPCARSSYFGQFCCKVLKTVNHG